MKLKIFVSYLKYKCDNKHSQHKVIVKFNSPLNYEMMWIYCSLCNYANQIWRILVLDVINCLKIQVMKVSSSAFASFYDFN